MIRKYDLITCTVHSGKQDSLDFTIVFCRSRVVLHPLNNNKIDHIIVYGRFKVGPFRNADAQRAIEAPNAKDTHK